LPPSGVFEVSPHDAEAITQANTELLTLHELIAHRLVQILWGASGGDVFGVGGVL
jgi:hypothetical protein